MTDPKAYTGRISNPGKFEGEMGYTAYYYELWLEGEGETHYPQAVEKDDEHLGMEYTVFTVDGEEDEAFSGDGLDCGDYVILWEDSQGFVSTKVISRKACHDDVVKWINDHAGV